MRISDWSADVCSSDLRIEQLAVTAGAAGACLQRLPDLRGAGGAHAAACVLELQAGRVERQPAGVEQRPDRAFRVALQGFVRLQVDVAANASSKGIHRALAVAHEGGDVVDVARTMRPPATELCVARQLR